MRLTVGRENIRLKELRNNYKPQKISQRKLAELTGISARKISEWELHIATPTPVEEAKLLEFFGLDNREQLFTHRR